MIDFFDLNKGDVVADVGAGRGDYAGAFSTLFDSVNFYVQDIDSELLNQKKLDKIIAHYNKIKASSQTNTFKICIGSQKESNLPNATFDKIILMSSIHEFTFMDEMIKDLATKLKPGGKLFILEAPCYAKDHKNYTLEEISSGMKRNGFKLVKNEEINGMQGTFKAIFSL